MTDLREEAGRLAERVVAELTAAERDLLAKGCNFGTVIDPPKGMRAGWTDLTMALSRKGLARASEFSTATDPKTEVQTITGRLTMTPFGQVISAHLEAAT